MNERDWIDDIAPAVKVLFVVIYFLGSTLAMVIAIFGYICPKEAIKYVSSFLCCLMLFCNSLSTFVSVFTIKRWRCWTNL